MTVTTTSNFRLRRPWLAAPLLLAALLVGCKDKPVTPTPPPAPPTQPTTSEVDAWLTTPEQSGARLTKQPFALNFASAAGDASQPIIEVNPQQQYQAIDGFGAAVTGSSAYLLQRKMTPAQREDVLRELFTTTGAGIGLSYIRMTIGSSDFSLGNNYSYDDVPGGQTDPTLANFSIAPDQQELLPVLQQIVALNPGIKLMGSPWSAPAWMKSSQNMIRGRLNTSAYPAFAQYFVKYVQAFRAAGVPVEAITVQNEPLFEPSGYPGMLMSAAEQTEFIKNHLGPAFSANNITTKVIAYDHNWDRPDYPITVLNDPGAKRYVVGSAFHGYGGNVSAMTTVHDAHPDKELYFTEQSGGEWSPGFANNLRGMTRDLIIGTTRNWSRNVLLWNLALDDNHGPTNGGCQDCRGVVTISQGTGAVTRNVEYYVLGHASKFVRPGAVRIASNAATGFPNVAFQNPDGSKVLLVLNDQSQGQAFRLKYNDKYLSFSLPAGAVATLKWSL